MNEMRKRPGYWTYDDSEGQRAYYFGPLHPTAPPYLHQRHVEAILDVASDGTLAGVELVFGDLPPPPTSLEELSWPPMRPISEEPENPSDEVLVLIFGLWSVMPYSLARVHRGALGWYPLPPLSPAKLEPTT